MQTIFTLRSLLAILASCALIQTAQADVMLSAQSVAAAPATLGLFTFGTTINQSGLSQLYTSGVTDFASYVAADPLHLQNSTPPNFAYTSTAAPFNVDYALGGTHSVNQLVLWNYPFANSAGLKQFEVYTSNDSAFATEILVGSFEAQDDGFSNGFQNISHAQVFDLADTNAAYVRIRALSNYRGSGGGGFSEIAFGADAVTQNVPEPSAAALVLVGLLAAAGVRRRRAVCSA